MSATTDQPIRDEAARSLVDMMREKVALVQFFRRNAMAKHGTPPLDADMRSNATAPQRPARRQEQQPSGISTNVAVSSPDKAGTPTGTILAAGLMTAALTVGSFWLGYKLNAAPEPKQKESTSI